MTDEEWAQNTGIMTDKQILDKWTPLLRFTDDTGDAVPVERYWECAFALNEFEIKSNNLLKKDAGKFLKRIIPMIRRSFTKTHKNRLDDCIFDIQKNHAHDEYNLVLYDKNLNQKVKYPASFVDAWVEDIELVNYLSKLPFKDSL